MHYIARQEWSPKLGKIIDLLLKTGAHINAKDFSGETPLDIAMQKNQVDTFTYLLRKNAKFGPKTKNPFDLAVNQGKVEIAKILETRQNIFVEKPHTSKSSNFSLHQNLLHDNWISFLRRNNHKDRANDFSSYETESTSSEYDSLTESDIQNLPSKVEMVARQIALDELRPIFYSFKKDNTQVRSDIQTIISQLQKTERDIRSLKKKSTVG